MSMTETTTEAPAKPKRHARANKKPRAAKPAEKPSVFAGITPADCPIACRVDRCVITEIGRCAHPHKGGLAADLQTPERLDRYNAAKRVLGARKLKLTSEDIA